MTPAVKALKNRKIPFELLSYHHQTNTQAYGLEAVEKLSLSENSVFKTLVLSTDKQKLTVAIVPVAHQVNLKLLAQVLSVKKVTMADEKKVVSNTGYILGGVSPIGQKKQLTTIIDESCLTLKTMYVSGGKRGLEIALSPADLINITQAETAPIT